MGTSTSLPVIGNKKVESVEKPEEKKVLWSIPKRKRHSIVDWFMKSEDDIIGDFMTLPGATLVGTGNKRFLYVPPTRPDPILLVAHIDTVFREPPKIGYHNGTYASLKKGVGIGADDRAGVAMLWKLRNTGHALLLPDGEESGCIGSRFLMENEEWRKKINTHRFAIEMDRMNANDLVFYSVGAPSFRKWCEEQFTGYKTASGSWTDICVLCDEDKHKENCLDGLNISVGYYRQHSDQEHLKIAEWQRTLSSMHRVLTQKQEIPRFAHKYTPYVAPPPRVSHSHGGGSSYNGYGYSGGMQRPSTPPSASRMADVMDNLFVCPDPECESIFEEAEYKQAGNACMYCKKPF